MLKLLDSSVDILRNNHKYGEQYYWILYYSFLSPQELRNTDEIIDKLVPHMGILSFRTFYRRRHAAIEALSAILWGYNGHAYSFRFFQHQKNGAIFVPKILSFSSMTSCT